MYLPFPAYLDHPVGYRSLISNNILGGDYLILEKMCKARHICLSNIVFQGWARSTTNAIGSILARETLTMTLPLLSLKGQWWGQENAFSIHFLFREGVKKIQNYCNYQIIEEQHILGACVLFDSFLLQISGHSKMRWLGLRPEHGLYNGGRLVLPLRSYSFKNYQIR